MSKQCGNERPGPGGGCLGALFALIFFAIFFGAFGYVAYLAAFGDGAFFPNSDGAWSWQSTQREPPRRGLTPVPLQLS